MSLVDNISVLTFLGKCYDFKNFERFCPIKNHLFLSHLWYFFWCHPLQKHTNIQIIRNWESVLWICHNQSRNYSSHYQSNCCFKGVLYPLTQNLHVLCAKNYQHFFEKKKHMQIVQGTQKLHLNFSWPSDFKLWIKIVEFITQELLDLLNS